MDHRSKYLMVFTLQSAPKESIHLSSYRNFCNIPDYFDGIVMYKYIAILCNFKVIHTWIWRENCFLVILTLHGLRILSFPITITPQPSPHPTNIIWTVAKFFRRRYLCQSQVIKIQLDEDTKILVSKPSNQNPVGWCTSYFPSGHPQFWVLGTTKVCNFFW